MDVEQLREVIMLAEKKNYAVAAEQLFISQSALSRHIAQLEDKLGVQLFERSPRKVSLTVYGEALLPFARDMIALENEGLETIAKIKEAGLNSVKIGSIRGLSTYGVMSLITGFIAEHKDINLSIDHAEINILKERLVEGKEDAIISYILSDDNDSSLRHLTICEDRLVAVIPKDHTLASRRMLSMHDLANVECVMQDDDRLINKLVSDIVRGSGISIKRSPVNVRGVGPMELASQGLGVAFEFEKIAMRHDLTGLVLIPLKEAKTINLDLVWSKNICEAGSVFVSFIKKHYKSIKM